MNHTIYKNHWRSYRGLGLVPYPADRKKKCPIIRWGPSAPPPTEADFASWEEKYPDANTWVYLGPRFVVLDPDGPEAEEFVKSLNLPPCPVSVSGNRSVHRWLKASSPLAPIRVPIGQNGSFLEVRTGSQGMLVPPSIHPNTGKAYRWRKGHSPWEIPFPEFPLEIYEQIRGLLPRPEPKMMPAQTENLSLGSLDVPRYLEHYGIPFKAKQDEERVIYALERCPFAAEHTTPDTAGDSAIIQGQEGMLGFHCFHNHCSSRTWQDARQAISGGAPVAQFCRGHKNPSPSPKEDQPPRPIAEAVLLADDFVSLDLPPRRGILSSWLVEQSILLVSGWRGTGKTWFLLALLDAITKGEKFGPWAEPNPVPSLYLDGEMAASEVQDRLKLLTSSVPRKAPLYVYCDAYASSLGIRRANLFDAKWCEEMQEILVSREIKLWVIDNLASLAANADENAKADWDPVNQWLIGLRFLGITTVMLHHTGKGGEQRGTSGREDNIDASILLIRPKDYAAEQGARFILTFSKHRARAKDPSDIADREFWLKEIEGRLVWTFSGTEVAKKIKKNKEEIFQMLADGFSQKDIAKALDIDKSTVSRIRKRLIEEERLTPEGKVPEDEF
jgi:hypothetical protein